LSSTNRRAYIDWARGIAVLLMIEAHTVDAWTRTADRGSAAYRNAIIAGGFAAPLFLWLAGVALVLSATRIARRENRAAAVDAVCRRGLEIFILAFLFRLQAFVVTPGSSPVTIFRVDILNIMGPAIAAAAILWGLFSSARSAAAACASIAAIFALAAPSIRASAAVDLLPVFAQWYIRPAGELTTFTAFPWMGFVFGGAAVGILLAEHGGASERRLHLVLASVGALLGSAGLAAASGPTVFAGATFWTTSPAYFVLRVGVLLLLLTGLRGVEALARPGTAASEILARFGRRSLLVYWIHVELVYGYATWPLHHRLPLWGTLAACAVFAGAMYGVVLLIDSLRAPTLRRKAIATA
jgi:uncharacterized membrane protein